MKIRTYRKNQLMFCPNCHQRVIPPDFLKNANIVSKGGININCGACKNGTVKVLTEES